MLTTFKINKLKDIFSQFPKIKLVYFFGSQAASRPGPLSDYDFAVYLDEKEKLKMLDLKCKLLDSLSRFLKTDKVDVVILNLAESPELKYNIIKEGKILLAKEPYKALIEPRILNEYFDFHIMLKRYKLTSA